MNRFKNRLSILLLLSLSLFLFQGCEDPPEPEAEETLGETTQSTGVLKVNFETMFEGEPFAIGQTYSDVLGHTVRIDEFKTYVSNFQLATDADPICLLEVDLINFIDNISYEFELDPGTYDAFNFNTGVPADKNKDVDPNLLPTDHPLGVYGSDGMHWSWATGYIFTNFEGKANLEGEESPLLDPFAFHCGTDEFFNDHSSASEVVITEGETTEITVTFNIDRFFYSDEDTIDISVDFLTHTNDNFELANRFNVNFSQAITIEQ